MMDEEKNVQLLHERLLEACRGLNKPFEIIFVDDGSRDKTAEVAAKLQPITLIRFRKNFGQTAAMDAGIKHAKGKYIVTLDGDLQNDPADIPRLLEKLQKEDFDAICGWRKDRKDPLLKHLVSRGAYALRSLFLSDDVHDSGCSLKAFRRECFENLDLYGEMHRFIPALLRLKGFKVGELVVKHHPRQHGVTKYGAARIIKGFLDILSVWFWKKYANRPLHLFGGMGILLMLLSVLSGAWAFYLKFQYGSDLSDTALTYFSMIGFLAGIQFFISGLLADIASKIYYSRSADLPYTIKDVITR